MFLFSCWPPRGFIPLAARGRGSDDGADVFLFKFLNLLSVCCRACFEFEATPLQVCGGLSYLKPWKDRKKPETLLSQVLTSFLRTCFTSCSLLALQREVLREGCCRWNAAVCVSLLQFDVLVQGSGVPFVTWDDELFAATRGCTSIDPGLDWRQWFLSCDDKLLSFKCKITADSMNSDWMLNFLQLTKSSWKFDFQLFGVTFVKEFKLACRSIIHRGGFHCSACKMSGVRKVSKVTTWNLFFFQDVHSTTGNCSDVFDLNRVPIIKTVWFSFHPQFD